MTPLTVATALLIAGGLAGVGWMLWPSIRDREEDGPEVRPLESDIAERLAGLRQYGMAEDDDGRPWEDQAPMLADLPRRVPWELAAAEVLPVVRTEEAVFLVPIAGALLQTEPEAPEVLRGRRQGRAFHAVRLSPGRYLDLVELARILPVIAVELEARGIQEAAVELFDDLKAVGAEDDELAAVAPWLAGVPGPRVVPEGEGSRRWRLTIAGVPVEVHGWLDGIAQGIRTDRLRWCAVLTWDQAIVESGAAPEEVLEKLVDDASATRARSLEAWRWSRGELAELAAVGHYLERQELPVLPFVEDALADRRLPMPDLHDEGQSLTAAAVLNWVSMVHRRAGYPQRALALLDGALRACAPDDDDNRADIHYNRGTCLLQRVVTSRAPPEPEEEASVALIEDPELRADLALARSEFELASRWAPDDAHAWSRLGIVAHLLGDLPSAEDAWLQAATRTRDPEVQRQMLCNAEAIRESR